MSSEQLYYSPLKTARVSFKVQGSRFIATLTPIAAELSARNVISSVTAEFPDATHHAYTYRIGSGSALVERSSDDREPAGTAGPPMLQVLQGKNISDAIVIGTRYFGGTKLGIGGLSRAYRDCALSSIEVAVLREKEPLSRYRLKITYEDFGTVTRLIESLGGSVMDADYSDSIVMTIELPARSDEALRQGFGAAGRGRGTFRKL